MPAGTVDPWCRWQGATHAPRAGSGPSSRLLTCQSATATSRPCVPSAGQARVAGFDVARQRTEVRRQIGLVFQDTTLDDYLTAEENLRFHAELYGVPKRVAGQRVQQVLEMVGLWD